MQRTHFGLGTARRQRKTLVILGAGATGGASFVVEKSAPLPPPLDLTWGRRLSQLA
jgi:hypothetical protein